MSDYDSVRLEILHCQKLLRNGNTNSQITKLQQAASLAYWMNNATENVAYYEEVRLT
jgi:hypothetical protein